MKIYIIMEGEDARLAFFDEEKAKLLLNSFPYLNAKIVEVDILDTER